LAWFRDHISRDIPRWWYQLVLGHDLHISTYADLYVQHYHASERDPFTVDLTEPLKWISEMRALAASSRP